MGQVGELELPVKVVSRTETDLTCEIEASDVWAWIQKLIARRFLITVNPSGIDGVRDREHVRLRVKGE